MLLSSFSGKTGRFRVLSIRGILRVGQWEDITVFDYATVIDHATYEDPAAAPREARSDP